MMQTVVQRVAEVTDQSSEFVSRQLDKFGPRDGLQLLNADASRINAGNLDRMTGPIEHVVFRPRDRMHRRPVSFEFI